MSKIIGIDLGTTNSVAAVMEGGEPTVIPSAEGGRLFPSVVAINPKTGERLVGQVAKRQAVVNPENTIFSVKRFMGRKYNDSVVMKARGFVPYEVREAPNGDIRVVMNNREYSPPEISAMVLQKMKKTAEDYLGQEVTEAVIPIDETQTVVAYNKKGKPEAAFQVVSSGPNNEVEQIIFMDKKHTDVYDVKAGMSGKEVKRLRRELKHMVKKGQVFLYDDQSNIMYLMDAKNMAGDEITAVDVESMDVQAVIWKDKKHHKKK